MYINTINLYKNLLHDYALLSKYDRYRTVTQDTTLGYFTMILEQFCQQLKLQTFSLIGNCIGASVSLNFAKKIEKTLCIIPKAGHFCMYEQEYFVNHQLELLFSNINLI